MTNYNGWRFPKGGEGSIININFTEPEYTVSLNHTNVTLTVGESVTLIATITPEGATTESMRWRDSNYNNYNTNIVTVEDGVVTAVAEGSTRILVYVGDCVVAACQVTVEAAVEPEPETTYYWYLGTEKLLTDEDVEAKGVQISDKSEITTLTWESAEYVYFIYPKEFGIAKIVDEGGDDAGGKAVEKLSNVNLEKYTGWRFNKYSQGMVCSISFTEPAYTVSLSHTNFTLTVGESVTLTATVTPEDATTESMWWEVYNTNIATVEDGVVTAVAEGSTRIIVHVGDYFAACQVTVEAAAVEPEPEAKYYWYVGVTDPRTLTPDNVGNEILDQWTEFTTEKESPVSVSKQDPEYNAHIWYIAAPYDWKYTLYNATGTASSEAAYKMYSAMIDGVRYKVWEGKGEAWQAVGQLTIANHVPITALSVEQSSITMTVGDVATVNVTKTPEDATVPNWQIAWTSSNEDVVFVSGGELHACAPGTAIITITDTDFYGNGASVSFEVIVEAAAVEPEPEPTPAPASVAFTFTRDADVAVNVEGIEGVTASIEAAPAAYLTTAAAANDSILCINQNTSTATADNPNKYTLTITNNSGVDLAFDYINVCGVALTSTGNFQGVRTVRDRVFVVSYGDNTLAPATMRICDDSHCSGVATVNTFEAVDAIPAGSTYVIGVSIYTDGSAGCFYGLTRITLGKNEPEGGDVTNIESPVLEAQGSQPIYDLTGRRVEKMDKGIYIVGGKKVVIK